MCDAAGGGWAGAETRGAGTRDPPTDAPGTESGADMAAVPSEVAGASEVAGGSASGLALSVSCIEAQGTEGKSCCTGKLLELLAKSVGAVVGLLRRTGGLRR